MLTHVTEVHVRPNAEAIPMPATRNEVPATLDLNAVVAFNIRAIRLMRGLTQDQVSDRLAEFSGHRLPQASISQMERSFVDRKRRRLFNAHDLYLLSKVFEVPIVYFFLPPSMCLDHTVANTGEPVGSLLDTVFGTPRSLGPVDKRLVEIADGTWESDISRSDHACPSEAGARHLHVSRLSEFDCNARLREIAILLRDLTDRHRGDDEVGSTSSAHP